MSLPNPYYEDSSCTIYQGDCREMLADLWFGVDLLLTDPPYGIAERCDRKSRKRTALAECNDFAQIVGDDAEFDPVPLLAFPKVVLFGANHFAHKLPPSSSWIVWDKLAGLTSKRGEGFNDNCDAELAWTNLGGTVRTFSHRWMGMLKDSERTEKRQHPTQKPVALMEWIIRKWTNPGDLILDPYMGSGPVLKAAKNTGRRAIGVEIEEAYCRVAAGRLAQEVLPLEVS